MIFLSFSLDAFAKHFIFELQVVHKKKDSANKNEAISSYSKKLVGNGLCYGVPIHSVQGLIE